MILFMLIAEFGPFLCFLLLVVKIGMTTSERSPVLSWKQACSSSNCHTDPSTDFKSWLFPAFIPFSSFSKHNQASWTRSWATNKATVRLKALRPLNKSTKCQYLKHLPTHSRAAEVLLWFTEKLWDDQQLPVPSLNGSWSMDLIVLEWQPWAFLAWSSGLCLKLTILVL